MKRLRQRHTNGFTLIETLLALVVLALSASAGYATLRTVIAQYQVLREGSVNASELAIATAILGRDLRSAYVTADQRQTAFVGRLTLEEPGSRLDLCQLQHPGQVPAEVGYFFKRQAGGEWQLWRRYQETLDADPLLGGHESLVCSRVKRFRVTYYDGATWTDTWGWDAERKRPFEGIRGLPLAVAIHLTVTNSRGQETSAHFRVPIMVALLNKGH